MHCCRNIKTNKLFNIPIRPGYNRNYTTPKLYNDKMDVLTATTAPVEIVEVQVDNDGNGPDTISLSFFLQGKLHNMARQKTEPISNTLKRLTATLNKSKDKRKSSGKRSPSKAMAVASPQVFDVTGNPIECWATLTNNDWQSGMSFKLSLEEAGPRYRVVVDPPVVVELGCFPRSRIMVGSLVAATSRCKRTNDCTYSWLAEYEDGVSAPVLVGEGPVYSPGIDACGARLKLVCTPEYTAEGKVVIGRPCVHYLNGSVSAAAPLSRAVGKCGSLDQAAENPAFRVMCYNILADVYANNEYARKVLFNYVSEAKFMHEDYRSQLIMNEILTSGADIVCLQEVERKLFNEYLSPCLSRHEGSRLVYDMRYTNKNGNNQEGCALMVSRSRFHIVYELDVPLGYAVFADPTFAELIQSNEDVADILGVRVGTIAQVAVVQDRLDPSSVAIVSNSHYFYHPKANYVRLMHTKALLDIIEEIKTRIIRPDSDCTVEGKTDRNGGDLSRLCSYRPAYVDDDRFKSSTVAADMVIRYSSPLFVAEDVDVKVSVLFMGDLNSRPGTAAVELIGSGVVDSKHPVWGGVDEFSWTEKRTEDEDIITTCDSPVPDLEKLSLGQEDDINSSERTWPVTLRHSLNLSSVVPGDHGEYYTNYTEGFKDVLDYMYVSHETVVVTRPPIFPTVTELSCEVAIPNSCFPSDHIPVISDLKFR